MKKIYYLMAFVVAAATFSACNPLDKTYKEIGDIPKPVTTVPTPPTIANISLTSDDYFFLPPVSSAKSNLFFSSDVDAINNIPFVLDKKYPDAVDKSQITVTYALTPTIPSPIKLVDSTFTHVAYTLTDADYLLVLGNTFKDFSDADLINKWFPVSPNAGNPTHAVGTSFAAPVNNTLAVVTWNEYNAGVTTTGYTGSFLYTGGAWKKIYTITPAQYTSLGKGGTSNDFAAADEPNLVAYFNTFLLADPAIASTAKVGDIQNVSFKYYGGSTTNTFQRVIPLVFDGTKWVHKALTGTETFGKTNGIWGVIYDNSVSYTLLAADYQVIAAIPKIGTITNPAATGAAADIKKYSDFTLTGGDAGTTRWTDAEIAIALDTILKAKYADVASPNQKFSVTFKVYGPYPNETALFRYSDTTKDFIYIPVPNADKYTLTGDDYVTVLDIPNVSKTPAAVTNLTQYGNFSYSAGWTDDEINAAIPVVLKKRYPTATANQTVAVTFGAYKGGNTTVTRSFKFDGTNWAVVGS